MIQSKLIKINKCSLKLGIIAFLFFSKSLLFAEFKTNKLGIALGYSSHEICSCMFIEKRAASECQADYGLTTIPIKIEIDTDKKQITEKFFHPASGALVLMRWARLDNNSCLLDSPPSL